MAGEIGFDKSGNVSSANVTITYNTRSDQDDEICQLTDPSDVSYKIGRNGVGTMTVGVASDDNCYNPNEATAKILVKASSPAITFRVFLNPNNLRGNIISTRSTLQDSSGDTVSVANTEGTLVSGQN